MSLEAHHQFILNTMQRHDDIARKFIHELEIENARLKTDYAALQAKVERLTKAGIAMGMALPDTDEANAAYRSFERVVKS